MSYRPAVASIPASLFVNASGFTVSGTFALPTSGTKVFEIATQGATPDAALSAFFRELVILDVTPNTRIIVANWPSPGSSLLTAPLGIEIGDEEYAETMTARERREVARQVI